MVFNLLSFKILVITMFEIVLGNTMLCKAIAIT